jgi:soluble lytic murein transglycosylase-like protein
MMVIRTLITVGFDRQWRPHRSVVAALLGSLLGAAAVLAPGALAAPRETSALPPPSLSAPAAPQPLPPGLPAILAHGDVALHHRILAAQSIGDWALADRLIGELHDQRLLGYILAERYLGPRFQASYGELTAWLRAYGDHIDAPRIHALALKHKPPHAPAPPGPTAVQVLAGSSSGEDDAGWHGPAAPVHAASPTVPVPAKGKPSKAPAKHAAAAAQSAEPALDASQAARHNPHAAWLAGLAAWRTGRPDLAIRNFEAVATSPASSSWNAAAGAFWAARGYLVTRHPQAYLRWMSRAAENTYTFYGLLARRALGQDINIDWSLPSLGPAELARLEQYPAALRAIALIQIGDRVRAEDELRRVYPRLPVALAPYALTIAERGGMPGLAMRMAGRLLQTAGQRYDAGLYPLPSWTPSGGFALNRALLFAIARIESGFNPNARNPSGASGLMQLMPGTARVMGLGKAGNGANVFDPQANLALGQRYVDMLLKHERVKGNLLSLIAAYNVGPGNLTPSPSEDPLLLIESMTSAETRQLVQRVLANFWIYQLRLGQPTDSLDQVAQGEMPVYTGNRVGDRALAERYGRD